MIATFFLIILELVVSLILQLFYVIFFWGMDGPLFPSKPIGWVRQIIWWLFWITIALLNEENLNSC